MTELDVLGAAWPVVVLSGSFWVVRALVTGRIVSGAHSEYLAARHQQELRQRIEQLEYDSSGLARPLNPSHSEGETPEQALARRERMVAKQLRTEAFAELDAIDRQNGLEL